MKKERETVSSPPPALSPEEASNDALNDFDNDEEKYGVVHNEDSRKSGNDSEQEVFDETSNGYQESNSNQPGNGTQNMEENSMDGFGNNNTTDASNTGVDENSEIYQDTDSKMGYEQ